MNILKYIFAQFIQIWNIINFPTFWMSLFFHELGHYIFAKAANFKPTSPKIYIVITENGIENASGFVDSIINTNSSKFSIYSYILAGPFFNLVLSVLGIALILDGFLIFGISLWITNLLMIVELFFYRSEIDSDLNMLINYEKTEILSQHIN